MAMVLVPIANGYEELEAIAIIDLLRRADTSVSTASLADTSIKARSRVNLIAKSALNDAINNKLDAIVLPSGLPSADQLNATPRIHQLIKQIYQQSGVVATICTASKVLAHNGIADGKKNTFYPGANQPDNYPKISITESAIGIN